MDRPLLVVAAVTLTAVVSVAAAHGAVQVVFDPAETTVEADERTTVDLVASGTDQGVGAFDLRVTVADPAVVRIANVTATRDPGSVDISVTNRTARIEAREVGRSSPSGSLVEVTLVGNADGTTDLDRTVSMLEPVVGQPYATDFEPAPLRVTVRETDGGTNVTRTTSPASGQGTATPGTVSTADRDEPEPSSGSESPLALAGGAAVALAAVLLLYASRY